MNPLTIGALVVALASFSAWHAWIAAGPRLAGAFVVVSVILSWALEELGATTGSVYGGYHYTSALGPQVGSVPVLIPLAWFALAYPTWVLVGLVGGRWGPAARGERSGIVASAFVGALLMTTWDLALDPILSGPAYGAWVWDGAGRAGAVPAQNYLGWTLTAFAILLAFRLLTRRAVGRSDSLVHAPSAARSIARAASAWRRSKVGTTRGRGGRSAAARCSASSVLSSCRQPATLPKETAPSDGRRVTLPLL